MVDLNESQQNALRLLRHWRGTWVWPGGHDMYVQPFIALWRRGLAERRATTMHYEFRLKEDTQ